MLRWSSKLGLAFLLLAGCLKAQDVHLSLYNQLPMLANPSMTGVFPGKMRASVLYRNQWMQVAPYQTYLFAFEMNVKEGIFSKSDYFATGLIGYQDAAGVMRYGNMEVRAQVAYHKFLGTEAMSQSDIVNFSRRKQMTLLSAGFSFGVIRRGINKPEELKAPNQWDGARYSSTTPIGENLTTATIFDVGAGALFIHRLNSGLTFTIAASFYHLLGPNVSVIQNQDKIYRRIGVYGNVRSPIGDQFAIKGGAVYWLQGPHNLLNIFAIGEYAINKDVDRLTIVEGGVVGDLNLGFGPYVGLEYKFIKVGLFYQFIMGAAKGVGQHTPEVLLQYINRTTESSAPRM